MTLTTINASVMAVRGKQIKREKGVTSDDQKKTKQCPSYLSHPHIHQPLLSQSVTNHCIVSFLTIRYITDLKKQILLWNSDNISEKNTFWQLNTFSPNSHYYNSVKSCFHYRNVSGQLFIDFFVLPIRLSLL